MSPHFSGNGWMAAIAHQSGWQTAVKVDIYTLTIPALGYTRWAPIGRFASCHDWNYTPTITTAAAPPLFDAIVGSHRSIALLVRR